jgi:hypothetical protein
MTATVVFVSGVGDGVELVGSGVDVAVKVEGVGFCVDVGVGELVVPGSEIVMGALVVVVAVVGVGVVVVVVVGTGVFGGVVVVVVVVVGA